MTGTVPSHNLPAELTRFVGREAEVAEVKRLLDESRMLTLTGSGGCGKTRLALHAASELADDYADGVWLVDLAPLVDGALVAHEVADAMSIPEQAGQPLTVTLISRLRSSSRLIVLDNCEHLVESCAALAEELLRSCGQLKVLATSREPLDIAGEAAWRVPSLLEVDAVALFADRARAADPSFVLSARSAPHVAAICARLDGIPLAIELAAARVSLISPEEILARLGDALRLLTRGRRTAAARHQTLRATIDWSHDLLTADERAMLASLSVFAGGFRLEAAEAVWGQNGRTAAALELIGRLVDRSMLQRSPQRDRYEMLETIRQYARERLAESSGLEEAADRHLRHFLELAEQTEELILGTDSATWLRRLDEEHGNLRAALEWALGRAPDRALALALAAGGFWYLRGHLTEGCSWLRRSLPHAPDEATRLRTLNLLGWLAVRAGDLDAADAALHDCLELERAAGVREWAAEVRNNLGLVSYWRGDFATAAAHFEQALALAGEIGDERSLAHALFNLGLLAYLTGDARGGEPRVSESLSILRRLGDQPGMALALGLLGCMAIDAGALATAAARLAEALGIARDLGDRVNVLFGLEACACLEVRRRRYRRALRLAGAAAGLRAAVGAMTFSLWQSRLDFALDVARRIVGPEAAAAVWSESQGMSLEEAIDYALAEPETDADAAGEPADVLSRREREIVELVAGGLSNREIAGRLFIGVRTVESHVANVMNKLGLNTRAQIAAWVVEQRLTWTRAPESGAGA